MLQFLECLNIANCIDSFPSGKEINQYASLCSCNFSSQGYGSGILLFWWCSAIPFNSLLFFVVKMVGTAFITSHHPWQYIIEATVIAHSSIPFHVCLSADEKPSDSKLSGIQKSPA
jgi:hypothetical protein